MAAVELFFLMFALINNVPAEDLIMIQKERGSHTFIPTAKANFCLISRLVGEEKLVLWNTSDPRSKNSTAPEDVKQRLSVVSEANISSYVIHNLTHLDSGQYQEECWTDGEVTYEKNISINICGTMDEIQSISVALGGGMDAPCKGAADNLDVQWLKRDIGHNEDIWTKDFGDGTTSVMDNVKGRFQVLKNTSALRVSKFNTKDHMLFTCLVFNQQQCVSSHPVQFYLKPNIIYRSVDEAAVLQCSVTDFRDDKPPLWRSFNYETYSFIGMFQNYTLSIPSLTLNHSGWYSCAVGNRAESYLLLVCPKFGPPTVELFSEGDEVTLRCRDLGEGMWYFWFIKSNQTEGRISVVSAVNSDLSMSRMSRYNDSLVITNASLRDTGEYWCAVTTPEKQCVLASKTLLKNREPYSIFYTVRCSLLSGLLLLLCAVVFAVIQRTSREAEG